MEVETCGQQTTQVNTQREITQEIYVVWCCAYNQKQRETYFFSLFKVTDYKLHHIYNFLFLKPYNDQNARDPIIGTWLTLMDQSG